MIYKTFEKLYREYKASRPDGIELAIDEKGIKLYGNEIGYNFIEEPKNDNDYNIAYFLAKVEIFIMVIRGDIKSREIIDKSINDGVENYLQAFHKYKEIGKATLLREVLNG